MPMTSVLAPLAKELGEDISRFAQAEAEFERKVAEVRRWLRYNPLISGVSNG